MTSPDSVTFTEVSLEEKKPKKLPKRTVYFSDGCLEEYSSEDEEEPIKVPQTLVDPSTLSWMPYLWYLTVCTGHKALAVCDFLGEHLAYFFGITSPKFQYEIEYSKELIEEEERLKKKQEAEYAGWMTTKPVTVLSNPIENVPFNSEVKIDGTSKANAAKESSVPQTSEKSRPETWERY